MGNNLTTSNIIGIVIISSGFLFMASLFRCVKRSGAVEPQEEQEGPRSRAVSDASTDYSRATTPAIGVEIA